MSRLTDELRLARMKDDYVVPPAGGREVRSADAERWRFRLAMLLVLLVLGVLAFFLVQLASGAFGQDPGVDTGQASAAGAAAVSLPPASG